MIRRFQIEELMLQDARGVIFGAFDSESQRQVSLRRFFPFGAEGGGLDEDEQAAYAVAVSRLSGVHHPGLRSVIAGGCDPVDGIPYIATERVDGASLDQLLARQPLAPAEAVALLTRALEVSAVLSEVLGEEAVWVETDVRMIVACGGETGRGFTFWISPLKWLGGDEARRGLESIVTLAEEIMHWQGRLVSDQAGRGLGGWLKWLRGAAPTTSLREAMDMLAAATGAEPPPPVTAMVREAPKPAKIKVHSAKPQLVAIAMLTLAVGGAGYWMMTQQAASQAIAVVEGEEISADVNAAPPAAAPAPEIPRTPVSTATEDPLARINRLAGEMSVQAAERDAAVAARREEIEKAGNVYQIADADLLMERKGEEVILEGLLAGIARSGSKKTVYLQFSRSPTTGEARGAVSADLLEGDLTEEKLSDLIGRKLRIRGKSAVEAAGKSRRPVVRFTDRSAIEVVE